MKIYFCDECNESIPLQDIKDNKAATLKGKIYCKNCNPLQEIPDYSKGASGSRLTQGLLIVVTILLGVVIYLMVWNQTGHEVEYATAEALDKARGLTLHLQENLTKLGNQLQTIQELAEERGSKFSKIESDILVMRGDLKGIRSENENMVNNFQSVTNVRERLDQFVLKQDEFSSSMSGYRKNLEGLETRFSEMETKVREINIALNERGALAASGSSGWKDETPKESPALAAVKDKLASKDDGERFEAVYQVQDERIKEALPLILPLIDDPDQFVQVGAIQTVGEFLYLEALPYLVRVLRDPDVTVRDEALRQLIRMTGQNDLTFDVRGSDVEREKAIKKWEKWLKVRS